MISLLFFILLCEAVGLSGSLFTAPAIPTWYATLAKPWFNPPSWLFAPVWTILYALMGISLHRLWRLGLHKKGIKSALFIFAIQLFFNFTWSLVFFGLRNPAAGLINIIILWIFIVASILEFSKYDSLAAKLLIPYLIWVSFATILNFSIWRLNS